VEAFLAGNSLNAFFYDDQEGRGISSAIDLALSARRPIAARRTAMVRHLFEADPSIFIEDRSLREIADSGLVPLQRYIDHWTAETVRADYEKMLDTVFSKETRELARARWFRRVTEIDSQMRVMQQQAELADRTSEEATRRAKEVAASSAERDRKLLHTLRSGLEEKSRSLRLGLSFARLLRSSSGLIKKSLGPRGCDAVRKIMRIGRS